MRVYWGEKSVRFLEVEKNYSSCNEHIREGGESDLGLAMDLGV